MSIPFFTNTAESQAYKALQTAEGKRNGIREQIALLSWGLVNEFRSGPVDMHAKRDQFIAQTPAEVQDAWTRTKTGPDAAYQPAHRLNVALNAFPDKALKMLPKLVEEFEQAEQSVLEARAAWRELYEQERNEQRETILKETMTVVEVAQEFEVSENTVRQACYRFTKGQPGGIPCRQSIGTYLIARADAESRWGK